MLFVEDNAVDVDEAVAERGNVVGIGFDGHATIVVENLADDVDTSVLYKFHDTIHRQIGESERELCLLVTLDDFAIFDSIGSRSLVGNDEPRCAKFDTPEIANNDDKNVGEFVGVDLPENGFSGSARRLPVVVAIELGAVGANHISPADMTSIVVFLLIRLDYILGLVGRRHGNSKRDEFAHFLLV